jgi:hypothetical protein
MENPAAEAVVPDLDTTRPDEVNIYGGVARKPGAVDGS